MLRDSSLTPGSCFCKSLIGFVREVPEYSSTSIHFWLRHLPPLAGSHLKSQKAWNECLRPYRSSRNETVLNLFLFPFDSSLPLRIVLISLDFLSSKSSKPFHFPIFPIRFSFFIEFLPQFPFENGLIISNLDPKGLSLFSLIHSHKS